MAVVSLLTASAIGQVAEQGTAGYAVAALTLAFLSGELFSRDAVELHYRHVEVPSLILYDRDPFTWFALLPELLADDHWQAVRIPDTLGLPHWDDLARTVGALDSHWAAHEPEAATNAE